MRHVRARVPGVLYLIAACAGGLPEMYRAKLLALPLDQLGSRLATAQSAPRLLFAAIVVSAACDVTLSRIFYDVFRSADERIALGAAFFRLSYATMFAFAGTFTFAAVAMFEDRSIGAEFSARQIAVAARQSLLIFGIAFDISLVFFGIHCVLLGWLMRRSRLFPQILGLLLAISGAGYIVNSFVQLIAPALSAVSFRYLLVPAGAGEFLLIIWLLAAGLKRSTSLGRETA